MTNVDPTSDDATVERFRFVDFMPNVVWMRVPPVLRRDDAERGDFTEQDFRDLMNDVARILLDKPNRKLSKGSENRYGTHGSLSVDLKAGTWYDHEGQQGGGTLELIMREKGLTSRADAVQWLWDNGFKPSGGGSSRSKKSKSDDKPKERIRGDSFPGLGKPAITYDYVDATGKLVFQTCRFEPKNFRPRQPDGASWIWDLEGLDDKLVVYRLPEVTEAIALGRTIYICEGEKDVNTAVEKLKLDATCAQGGTGGWRDVYVETFRGADVVIVPDNDPQTVNKKTGELQFHPDGRPKYAGLDYAERIAASLAGVASKIRILKLWEGWKECPPKGDLHDWHYKGGGTREQFDALVKELPDADEENLPGEYWDGEGEEDIDVAWLIHELLPQVGTGLIAGQWGTYKTFVAIDLALTIAHAAMFLGRGVRRTGGIMFVAVEGAADVRRRVTAVRSAKYKVKKSPFTWHDNLSSLLTKEGVDDLIAKAKRAKAKLERKFGVPLVLIVIDTVAVAAAYAKSGDENDSAVANTLMANLARVAKELDCFVLGVDHFGKAVDTGTRGSSAKEASADTVLALLGDRDPRRQGEQDAPVRPQEPARHAGRRVLVRGGEGLARPRQVRPADNQPHHQVARSRAAVGCSRQ
jgi:hypothetical protein